MRNKKINNHQTLLKNILMAAMVFMLISCQSNATTSTSVVNTENATEAAPDVPAVVASPTVAITPPALPAIFQTEILNPLDTPHSYIADSCQYLKSRWSEFNAKPGTVVMIILLKGIYKGTVEEPGGIDPVNLDKLMQELKKQEFVAINTQQLLDFMERNALIPPRSVMIIQDGNRQYENYTKHLGDYWQDWGWPVVNGWISQPNTPETLWEDNIALEKDGFVDHQANGVMFGTYLSDDISKAVLDQELQGSIDAFSSRFGKNPIAFIWPGGGFGQRPVTAARQLKYQLGFTSNSRGPVMYNWVPLADELDPGRPAYIPEGKIGDPLMTLPRYWPYEALLAIDGVRAIGNDAADYAQANKQTEIDYYNIVCAPTYGQLPTP